MNQNEANIIGNYFAGIGRIGEKSILERTIKNRQAFGIIPKSLPDAISGCIRNTPNPPSVFRSVRPWLHIEPDLSPCNPYGTRSA